ncbi:hypothetical protein [uncultured Actinomyces sp.]|uniref:hypothetical protein n=1 Tax=uncultured Actinomyces sp. TaxID=249061 RepID=UPI0028049B78|nr:hypothetical protein [uncultured Actinomyces sp.]
MYLSPTSQNNVAAHIADHIRRNTIGYGAVATQVGRAGYPDAAVVAIAETGHTDCTAKVAIHHNRLVYVSATGGHVSFPIDWSDAGRIICAFLSLEHN